MDEKFSFSDFPIRSEELLVIQNDILNIQDGLDKVVNENNSRNNFLNQASRNFFEFLQQLHKRGDVLQQYAKTLIERENELANEQKKYNTDLFNLRVINVDLPAEEEKLTDLKEKSNELTEKRKRITKKIENLKSKIQSMISEHNSMSAQFDSIQLTITDNLYDNMGDTNVNVFIEVQNLRNSIEKVLNQIEETKKNIQNNDEKLSYINENNESILLIKQSIKNIPEIQENISTISKQLKEIRLKQKDERVKALKYSTELNQLCKQQDEVFDNLEMTKSFNSKIPQLNSKVIKSENQINEIKNDLQIQLEENQNQNLKFVEIEQKTKEELDYLNNKIIKANKKSDLIESQIAEVEILIDDQNREKMKNLNGNSNQEKQKNKNLNDLDNRYQNEKVKNALLNFNIQNPAKFLFNDDEIYNEKKKVLKNCDEINKEITETNYQIGQIHFKIEFELMRQNVLDAEKDRVSDFQDSVKSDKKQFKSFIKNEGKTNFKNDNKNENSVAEFISKRKIEREKQIIKQKQDLNSLENMVSIKKSRSIIKSQKISRAKKFYEQSIQNWTKPSEKTEIKSDSFTDINFSKIEKILLKKNELFKTYIQKVSDAFQSQKFFWEIFEKKDEDETRESLINWAMQVDQVNKRLQTFSNQSISSIKNQSYQTSKTVSTYLENVDNNTFSYSELK